jgi:predicted transposase/invertase (TIGR01784 family)
MTHYKTHYDPAKLPSGPLKYTLKNDYMFRAVLQKNKRALKGLLYALLGLPEGSITSVDILNPIEPGATIDDKTCVLDIKVSVNNTHYINLEMQVLDHGNWPERSLVYLGRAFDQLRKGEDYENIKPTIHIGILDFKLPHLTPEFYSEYMMLNTKNHEVYSDKFILRVLNLWLVDDNIVKEPEDLYYWAKLFKAETWEELKMIAEKNSYMEDAIVTYHEMTEDEKVREQCEAREKYYWDRASIYNKGLAEGVSKLQQLITLLVNDNRMEDIKLIGEDSDYLNRLLAEYKL